jgi:hypothetical protein
MSKRFRVLTFTAFVGVGLMPARSAPAVFPNISGIWKRLGSDDRVMTIKSVSGKITVEALDLSCTLTDLKSPEPADPLSPPSVTASGVCDEESFTAYTKDTLTVLRVGQDVFLIDASVLIRLVNENSDPKQDEAYTNQAPTISMYRKLHR